MRPMERPHTEMNDSNDDGSPVIAAESNAWWEMVGYGIAQARHITASMSLLVVRAEIGSLF